jgi:hypothetical protein
VDKESGCFPWDTSAGTKAKKRSLISHQRMIAARTKKDALQRFSYAM